MNTPKKPAGDIIEKLRREVETLPLAEKARRLEKVLAKVRDTGMTDAEFRNFVVKTLAGE